MAMKNIDVTIRYAYVRLRRRLELYFTLWFLALLAGVSLIIDSIFINPTATSLKLWSVLLVVLLAIKLAYDSATKMKKDYITFRDENKLTDELLRFI